MWSFQLDLLGASEARAFVSEVEALGYGAVWMPESVGSKEIMSHAAVLLGGGERVVVATGIASIWARDPMAMANAARALADAWPGRFLLGIGVSHRPAAGVRGHRYDQPLRRMHEYLDAMAKARYVGSEMAEPAPLVLAALGPKMLRLAAERTAGAHPYFVPVEHTSFARERLGPGPLLAVEQAAVLETDPAAARRIAREHMRRYLRLENYANNLRRLGFTDGDIAADGGSDRLVDAIVAWGDVAAVRERVREHHARGADHVCLQLFDADPRGTRLAQLRELAPALLSLSAAPGDR